MWNKYITMALLGLAVLAGCKTIEEPEEPTPEVRPEETGSSYTLTLKASKGADTKALFLDTSGTSDALTAYWKNTEKVKVYKDGSCIGELSVTPGSGDKPLDATLSGEITVSGLAAGNTLTLLIPRESWDYTGQVGTLADIESKYDYATATVTVKAIDGNSITTNEDANFINQQSVYRFGFKIKNTESFVTVSGFTVSSANNALVRACGINGTATESGSITVTPASATSELIYAALRNTRAGSSQADTYSFDVIGDDNSLYLGEKAIPASVMGTQGKFISAKSVEVTKATITKNTTTTTEVW